MRIQPLYKLSFAVLLVLAAMVLTLTGCCYPFGCPTSMNIESAYAFLKCGGMGGERNYYDCSWRKTSVFAVEARYQRERCAHNIGWKHVIVQNAVLGYQSADDEWQIETDGAVPARRPKTWCLRRHVANTTHWSDCVTSGSLRTAKRVAEEKQ